MKAVMRIALLLIAIAGLTLSGFNNISPARAFGSCNAPIYQDPPAGYVFKGIINCDGVDYELWQHPIMGHIRRPDI